MTTMMINNDAKAKLYRATMNGAVPMDDTGNKLFNKAVDRSMIVFPDWQRVDTSSEKKIAALRKNFDKNLMDPLLLVAWPEEECFHCANGYHRYTATEGLDGMQELPCVILIGPENRKDRKEFEINLFLKQSVSTEPLKAVQMHVARLEIGDPGAVILQDLCDKYEITIPDNKGQRADHVLGSYDTTYNIAKQVNGRRRLGDIFEVLEIAGYTKETNGLSCVIMSPVDNILQQYGFVKMELGEYMRTMSPRNLISKAAARYPERGWRVQLTLFLQDWIVATYNVDPKYNAKGKLIKVA